MERATLIEVKTDEQTLVVIDGRTLTVDPETCQRQFVGGLPRYWRSRRQTTIRFSTSASKSKAPMKRFVRAGDERMNSPDPPSTGPGNAALCSNEKMVDVSRFSHLHGCGGLDKSFQS